MKKLVRIKLINWHFLVNETITIKGNTLITGENGAGKSTVLDAIQYVLTGGKQKFNTAANDKANRDLIGYVRCKTGLDSNQYLRNGDVTNHIALEFYDELKKKYFIVGSVIDSASNLSTPKTLFYRIEDEQISDDLFLDGTTPKKISDFRFYIKSFNSKVMNTQDEARKDFCHRFGSLNERFIDLLPKALAFRPINNVKDFVYSYLLDAKEINIDFLKENIRTLTEYEAYLKQVKEKIKRLEEIEQQYHELLMVDDHIKIQDYIVKRSDKDIVELKIREKTFEKEQLESKISFMKHEYDFLNQQLNSEREYRLELQKSLINNNQYQLLLSLESKKIEMESKINILSEKNQKLNQKLNIMYDLILQLHQKNCHLKGMEEVYAFKNQNISKENIENFLSSLNLLANELKEFNDNNFNELARLNFNKTNKLKDLQKLNEDIKTLNSKKLIYPDYVLRLKDAITKEAKAEIGKDIEPKVLCELLTLKDDTWQNAIEGYLNTQRFNLIVDPEYFDISLKIYERVKFKLNIHTTGLVNTQKLADFEEEHESSLAYVVGSNNNHAKRYVNMMLNRVIRCEHVDELKLHPIAITKTCMVYQNQTARQIKEEVYKTPYIGADAYKKQLDLKIIERDDLQKEIEVLDQQIHTINSIKELTNRFEIAYLIEHCFEKIEITSLNDELTNLLRQMIEIDTSSFLQLEMKIDEINKKIKDLETRTAELNSEISYTKARMEQHVEDSNRFENDLTVLSFNLKQFESLIFGLLNKAEERYKEAIKDKDLITVRDNYNRQKSGSLTRYDNLLNRLKDHQRDYNRDYHFGAALGNEGMDAFFSEFKLLKESKVIEYEEKINESKKKAEEEFQDEFISKLQENIYKAQTEFKKLNDALKGIIFGQDEYKFECFADKENEKFFKMIMDDSNISGQSLFSSSFRDKHKEALDELFDRISIDTDESKRALDRYTDYRTYMDYDIKIMNPTGTASFSKVCREKSGGETQTPFYVAIAASFKQLYSHIHHDAIGIILFDEAFDKMDENRIESMMTFLNKLDLQIILAAPPQKIESIAPFVKTTLVVNREDHMSFIEEFHDERR